MNRLDVFPRRSSDPLVTTVDVEELTRQAEMGKNCLTRDCNSKYQVTWYDLEGKSWEEIEEIAKSSPDSTLREYWSWFTYTAYTKLAVVDLRKALPQICRLFQPL